MPYTKLLIHVVFSTKDRKPFLTTENRHALISHIKEYAKTKNIFIININGYKEHLHILLSLSSEQSVANCMNLIKGESSHWANKNLKFAEKFGWQDEYFAVSISKSHLETIDNYITNQVEHHKKKRFRKSIMNF